MQSTPKVVHVRGQVGVKRKVSARVGCSTCLVILDDLSLLLNTYHNFIPML